jgi:hypothetical protein
MATAMQSPRLQPPRAVPAPCRGALPLVGLAVLLALLLAGCAQGGTETATSGPFSDTAAAFASETCTSCHAGATAPDLTNCTALVNQAAPLGGTLIVPNDTANSVVDQVATGTVASPDGSTNMTFSDSNDVTTLEDWINSGALCQ